MERILCLRPRRDRPCDISLSDLWPLEWGQCVSVVLNRPVCGAWSQQPQETSPLLFPCSLLPGK